MSSLFIVSNVSYMRNDIYIIYVSMIVEFFHYCILYDIHVI